VTVSNYTGSTKTLFWRVFFLAPSTVDPDVASTALSSIPITFNTDYNYTKLVAEGFVTTSTTITHDLGHYPQVALWTDTSAGVFEMEVADSRDPAMASVEVTTTKLIIPIGPVYPGVHYRIYGDQG
jgi:hypothetical protein